MVRSLSMEILLIDIAAKNFDVTTPTIDVLLVLDSELNDERLIDIADLVKLSGG